MRKSGLEALKLETYALEEKAQVCDAPGCRDGGQYRAPRGRKTLNEYFWFCLDHVRQYNKSWNYYDGLNDAQVETEIRRSAVWDRPSWPLGSRGATLDGHPMRDDLDIFGAAGLGAKPEAPPRPRADTPEAQALAVMGLNTPVTMEVLKSRYKDLVKRHHPDANGGDKKAEETFKSINAAYATLKSFLS